ncbi:ABC transporter permease [Oscillospiraceae bacterium WX1]
MKQFWTVLRFEFSHYAKSKPYIIITAILVVLMAGLLSYPRLSGLFHKEGQPSAEKSKLAVVDKAYGGSLTAALSRVFPDDALVETDESVDVLREKVESGEYRAALYLASPLDFTYITVSLSVYESPGQTIGAILKAKYQETKLAELGLTAEEAAALINPAVNATVTETGKSQTESIIYTYILIYALYMAIILYGQFVASSVASEKSTRAMELLITSANPMSLLFGKVIGTGLAGLAQFGLIFGSAFLFYNLNADVWANNLIIQNIFNIPLDMFLYVLLFFFIGFFFYAFIYGALGSLASRMEDVGTTILPVTFLFIIAFFVVYFGIMAGKVSSPLMIVSSYIPFTLPMAMFTRIAMSNVAPVEIIISIAVGIISTVGVGYLSAAIYRIGILLYGKPPKLSELVKTLRQKN